MRGHLLINYWSGQRTRKHQGFTLIEVVISLAVITLAVISIMGLMAVFLQGTKAVVERNEALSICQALTAYLQMPNNATTPATQGFDKVYAWIQSGTPPNLYASSIPVNPGSGVYTATGIPQLEVVSSDDANLTNYNAVTSATQRLGRLYYISISLSPNVPIHLGVVRTASYSPTFGVLPPIAEIYPTGSADTKFYADSTLALSVRVYAIPGLTPTPSVAALEGNFNYPILVYDTSVSR